MNSSQSRLQKEIRQRLPFRTRGQEPFLSVLHTADVLRRRFSGQLTPYEITLQQYNVLRILRGAANEGLPTLAIAERMIEHTPGITRLLDRLEQKGCVRRQRSTNDRRQVQCRITARGRRLLEKLDQPVDRAVDELVSMLSDGQLKTLIRLLDQLRAGSSREKTSRRRKL